jgi:hypothetical protein
MNWRQPHIRRQIIIIAAATSRTNTISGHTKEAITFQLHSKMDHPLWTVLPEFRGAYISRPENARANVKMLDDALSCPFISVVKPYICSLDMSVNENSRASCGMESQLPWSPPRKLFNLL